MNDPEILQRIEELVNEEHHPPQRSPQGGLSDEEHTRLRQLEVSLHQCWDLLRQRRALRSAHLNPDQAKVRDADIVEHYKQ